MSRYDLQGQHGRIPPLRRATSGKLAAVLTVIGAHGNHQRTKFDAIFGPRREIARNDARPSVCSFCEYGVMIFWKIFTKHAFNAESASNYASRHSLPRLRCNIVPQTGPSTHVPSRGRGRRLLCFEFDPAQAAILLRRNLEI